ncbi:Outer membrane lipoprotein carrier protein LolA [Succinivibrio dextrinosolvens DSM 3072]|uniref:Outer membrane lipoprotein carrier protein LolA n=1 Tax=Succinivibrio dextrinosolvens DSM 3072 TaxID=1123324 RepID=A0A1T4V6U0_9GAMM|nr:outer membrane lipoprotein carrier protein LolA [Succinivibrio dextrinosolvens]SKA60644.1 Outer membrane lipoprotein carrier protein LolA [Succinivibrio dextrinosolvens DSM 3072]
MSSFIKNILTAMLLTLCTAQCTLALTLNEIGEKLKNAGSHSVMFTQEKLLKDADLTLSSSGRILSIKDKGILIKQTSPYEMQLCITKDAITEYSAGEIHIIRANDNPAVHSLLNLLLKLMTLDDTVADDFEYKLTGDKNRYTVTLSPKDANLKNFFEEITIDGSEYIDSLIIRGTHGDVTSMKFSDYNISDNAVKPEDLKYFE